IEANIRHADIHTPKTKIVTIENTHNRHGGTIHPLDEIKKIRKVADKYDLLMHLDGARLWNAHIASGISLADWTAPFDSVSVCFSKGLGAPIGSMLLGSRDFIEEARRNRKMFGGGMRQVGIVASAAIYALDNNMARLADDHANAKLLADGLNSIDGFEVDISRVETNIVLVDISGTNKNSDEMVELFEENGILTIP
ncbi:MAG: aminotransferase class I/II-fold pyridoxal phosphate-dependent enzyme, partial [bacterium]|nr:aminotransferase class I/II-fold pyridoxal phosphate-dependent enzyme [bacterium]